MCVCSDQPSAVHGARPNMSHRAEFMMRRNLMTKPHSTSPDKSTYFWFVLLDVTESQMLTELSTLSIVLSEDKMKTT